MDFILRCYSEEDLAALVHDLRQPLSTIGLSASYLEMVLEDATEHAKEQVRSIQHQVDRLSAMLDQTAAQLRRAGLQRARESVESRDSTKPQSAAVA
ncbi:MAG: hypothetical protein LAQ30_07100 [Acidobacteriia bacterium]|nr:hypothetical protein [Terriglobia bacterium]